MKIVIDLDDVFQPDDILYPLIVSCKTNVFYRVQAGGISCSHPEAEGFVIRIRCGDIISFDDCDMGCWHRTGFEDKDHEYKMRANENRKKHAEEIDKCLSKYENHDFGQQAFIQSVKFNYDKIDELMEGWWPVTVTMGLREDFGSEIKAELQIVEGYIHAGNCD